MDALEMLGGAAAVVGGAALVVSGVTACAASTPLVVTGVGAVVTGGVCWGGLAAAAGGVALAGLGIAMMMDGGSNLGDDFGRLESTGGRGSGAADEGRVADPGEVADRMAAHAGDRSIPGVADEDIPEYLENIMQNPGRRLRDTPGGSPRTGWWDPDTGTMVIREGNGGTFFQPDRGYDYFLEQVGQ